jgi:nitrogen PTS system EIIA component
LPDTPRGAGIAGAPFVSHRTALSRPAPDEFLPHCGKTRAIIRPFRDYPSGGMRFSDLLTPDSVVADLRARSRGAVLEALAQLMAPPDQALAVLEALTEREGLGSTALGQGFALPHGRSAVLDHPRAAFVRLDRPIAFGAADGKPVDLFAAIATPSHFTTEHLSLLADIATRAANPAALSRLRAARHASALHAELAEWGQPA